MAYEKVMGRPHPSVRRHRLLKAALPGVNTVISQSTSCNTSVQKSVKSQPSREESIEAFNATSTSSDTDVEQR